MSRLSPPTTTEPATKYAGKDGDADIDRDVDRDTDKNVNRDSDKYPNIDQDRDTNVDSDALQREASAEIAPSSTSSASSIAPYKFHLFDLLIVLSHHQRFIMRATLAAAILASVVGLLLPIRYTAKATILPPQQSQSLASSMIGQLGALGPMAGLAQKDLGLKNPSDLYVGMLRSRTAEDDLIRQFDLLRVYRDRRMSDARRDLEDASAVVSGKEGFISISVEDKDRLRAAEIANAYVDQLRQLTQALAVTEAGQRRLFFERQLEQAKNKLSDAEQALKQTEHKTGLIQLDGQAKAIIESVVKLRGLMAEKEVALRTRRLFSTEQNPDVMLGEEQLSALRVQLTLLEKQSAGTGGNGNRSANHRDSNKDKGEDEANYDDYRDERDRANDSHFQVSAGNVPEASLEYVRRMRDLKYAETMFEMLAKQYEAARLDEAKTAAVIQVLDPAIEPDRSSSPKRGLIIFGAVVFGFFGSVAYVIAAEAVVEMGRDPKMGYRVHALRELMQRPMLRRKQAHR
jgi:tyrosine-protein kinase Etk/Wzc